MRGCEVANCTGTHYGHGLCNKHYQRHRIYGIADLPLKIAPPGTPHLTSGKYYAIGKRLLHVLVAEKALGKSLPVGAEVHHVDGNGLNNENSNLVVCPSHEYHHLLHRRQVALEESGDPNKRKCCYCKQWDDPENITVRKTRTASIVHHKECEHRYNLERYARNKAKKGALNG